MLNKITPAELVELKRLKEAATPGPTKYRKGLYLACAHSENAECCCDYATYQRPEDAQYDVALRNTADGIIEAAEDLEELRDVPEVNWISVEDRLPELYESYKGSPLTSGPVLAFNGSYVVIAEYSQTYAKRIARWTAGNVTHWAPLPAPPAKERNNAD